MGITCHKYVRRDHMMKYITFGEEINGLNCEAEYVLVLNYHIFFRQMSKNVPTELIAVIPMRHVLILLEVSLVHATLVLLVTEQSAQVHLLYLLVFISLSQTPSKVKFTQQHINITSSSEEISHALLLRLHIKLL